MVRTRVVVAVGAAVALGVAAFASTAASQTARPAADDPNNASLTYWYWGEDDAPGANGWLKKEVAAYEKAHPKVKISVVTQSTDTLTSAFTTAAQTKSGPDIATQWATLPVLTPAWNGCVGADLRLRACERDQELDRHVREHVRRQALGDAAVPARHPVRLEQGDVQEGGPRIRTRGRRPGRSSWPTRRS